ncbi:heme-binding protein [Phenylobacterium hankyongense]|uniref:Heme-binding protein n=1 Tax=Phenylobacterium hankyongense TaxID=1813876 RepID=A0A328AYN4_9CAUL|nr:heme-binding protein [Phenylobacterium hankyongense]RAK60242.1 heme-binding protein [Phenylobacterium hankyongense]
MTSLNLEKASRIVDAALEHAASQGMKPLTVAVLDAGGHLVAFKRQDRTGILRPAIAQGKAWGALGMGLGGRALAQRAEMAPAFFTALASASDGRVIPVPGGVLIKNAEGDVVGAVGISGDLPDNDEACAVYGIEQAGLIADPGQPH